MSTTKWVLDPNHSHVGFKVKHLMISTVSGEFTKFEGSVETPGDSFADAQVSFTAQVDSISTSNEQRDGHLKSGDFFDAAQFARFDGYALIAVPNVFGARRLPLEDAGSVAHALSDVT